MHALPRARIALVPLRLAARGARRALRGEAHLHSAAATGAAAAAPGLPQDSPSREGAGDRARRRRRLRIGGNCALPQRRLSAREPRRPHRRSEARPVPHLARLLHRRARARVRGQGARVHDDQQHHGLGADGGHTRAYRRSALAGPYLLGEQFTTADILFGSTFALFKGSPLLPPNETILAYIDRVAKRPA